MRINIVPSKKGQNAKDAGVPEVGDTSFVARGKSKEATRSEYEQLLQGIYDAVLITDSKGRVAEFNSRALDFFLCDRAEMTGSPILRFISGSDESLLEAIQKNLKDHRYTLIEAHCVRRDGTRFPSEVAVNRIELDGKSRLCFFIRDISVRKKAQEELEKAVARLEAHDRARSQFVSNVSHELRTPLTSMIYAVSNMLNGVVGPLPERVKGYLRMLDGDCRRLLVTVNDILDLTRIESNALDLARAKVSLCRLVRHAVESLRVQAERKGLEIVVEEEDPKCFVYCDPQKIERVILNVVGNALKFTPNGGSIRVRISEEGKGSGYALVSVEDTGVGIPKDMIAKVMERYVTVGVTASGSGLGLAISREIVRLHDGDIELKSPPVGRERGTGVYIHLPVTESPVILIVDDDEQVRQVLVEQISAEGYKVLTCDRGDEALDIVKRERPDLVLLDVALPGMDGTEVILKMKSDKDMRRIPIIVVTGVNVGRPKAEILNNFSIPAFQKPWPEGELLDRIAGVFLGMASLSRTPSVGQVDISGPTVASEAKEKK